MIPTAESVLRKHLIAKLETGKDSIQDESEAINDAMIEFAKFHVEAALEAAGETQKETCICSNKPCNCCDKSKRIQQEILNAYPLTNIK
jgi:hypothetical protein